MLSFLLDVGSGCSHLVVGFYIFPFEIEYLRKACAKTYCGMKKGFGRKNAAFRIRCEYVHILHVHNSGNIKHVESVPTGSKQASPIYKVNIRLLDVAGVVSM